MKNKKVMLALSTIVLLLLIYIIGVQFYNNRALPQTRINGIRVSNLNLNRLNKKMEASETWEDIVIIIKDQDELIIKDEDIDYEYYGNDEFREIVETSSWQWPLEIFKKKNHEIEVLAIYNYEKLKNVIAGHKAFTQELKNANLVYSDEKEEFVITPHSCSMKLTVDEITEKIKEAINNKEEKIDLTEFQECPEILPTSEVLINAKEKANKLLNIELTYDFVEEKEIVNKDLIKQWLQFENGELTLNKELMREYIDNLGNKYDTFGKQRTFKTTAGETKTITRSAYGWLIHRGDSVNKLAEDILQGESKIVEPVYSYSAANRGKNDMGNSYVEIDINKQMVYVYNNGELKVSTPTVTGNVKRGHATPLGIDFLTYKTTNATLRGPGYATPVKYWMPFNGGVGLHDASWRGNFGGNIYKTNGSHGCINLPPSVAKSVYDSVYQGMPVIVH